MIPSCITYAPTQHSLHAWLRLAVLSLRFLPPTNAPVIMFWIASVCVFLVAFVPTLTSRQPTPLPLLSYIPNSTTANLCTLTSTQTNRLQHIQNFLARTVASPPKYSHNHPCSWISFTGKKSTNACNINWFLLSLLRKFSPPVNSTNLSAQSHLSSNWQ